MKNLYLVGCVIVFFGYISVANAAPVGNPAKSILEKGDTSFKIGVELDFVTERDLDVSDEDVSIEELNWYAAKISFSITNRVEPYILLGAAGGEFTEKYTGVDLTYETETDFAWGIGTTILLYELENGIRVGLDGRYRSVEPNIDKIILNNVSYSPGDVGISDFSAEYSEWQIAFGVSKEFGQFVPYGGIKYTDVEASMQATISGTTYKTDDVNSDDVIGIFVGCDFLPIENFSINVEGRFIDETAFSVALNYRF
jgi:opacity protein-like surface antigen